MVGFKAFVDLDTNENSPKNRIHETLNEDFINLVVLSDWHVDDRVQLGRVQTCFLDRGLG